MRDKIDFIVNKNIEKIEKRNLYDNFSSRNLQDFDKKFINSSFSDANFRSPELKKTALKQRLLFA